MGGTSSSCMRNCCMNSTHEYAEDLLRNPDQPRSHGSSSSRAETPQRALVPPVSNWLQAVKQQRGQQLETPRFEEVLRSSPRVDGESTATGSPRGSVGGEFQTPRDTPRPGADEGGGGKIEELSYQGSYRDQMKHGEGVLRCTNSTYDGQFEWDHKHGHGTLCWHDGRCYSGQFEMGKFHGTAVMTWPDGRVFDGQYIQDRKHGDGTFSWSDGRRYAGQWVCGKRHGTGTYTNAKGLTRRGWWQNDRPVHWDPVEESSRSAAAAAAVPPGPAGLGAGGEARLAVFPPLKESTTEVVPEATSPKGAENGGALPSSLRPHGGAEQMKVQVASELPLPPAGASEGPDADGSAAKPEESLEDHGTLPATLASPRLSPRVCSDAI